MIRRPLYVLPSVNTLLHEKFTAQQSKATDNSVFLLK